jgi:hypothetical protein
MQRRDCRVQLGDTDVQFLWLFGIVSHTNLLRGRRRQGLKSEQLVGMRSGILPPLRHYGQMLLVAIRTSREQWRHRVVALTTTHI